MVGSSTAPVKPMNQSPTPMPAEQIVGDSAAGATLAMAPAGAMDELRSAALPRSVARAGLPWPSLLIHSGLLVLWVLLFAMAFSPDGFKAWAVGVAYVSYDTVLLLFVAWQTWELRRRWVARHEGSSADGARVRRHQTAGVQDLRLASSSAAPMCVLIAAHNEAGALPLTLAALRAQSDAPERIVVVDDGSTDATAAWLAAEYGIAAPPVGALSSPAPAWPALHWLRLPHSGKARALNQALATVSEELVLTVDGDTLLEPDALAAVRAAFVAEPDLAAVTGVILPVCGPGWRARVFQWFQTYEYIRNFLSRYAWMRMESLLLVSGAFAGYRRSALIAVGGFDPASMVEDYELTHRLCHYARNRGLHWVVRVLGDARARTDAPASLRAFLRQRRRWFGGFLQTQYRYRAMVGDRRYGWLGTLMLPVKAIDTLQPLYGLTAFLLLVFYVASGRLTVLGAAASVIGIKLGIDFAFHLWSIHLYRQWVGGTARARLGEGLLAALAEPFTFQLLRHLGAAMGWVAFLTQRWHWGRPERAGIVADAESGGTGADR